MKKRAWLLLLTLVVTAALTLPAVIGLLLEREVREHQFLADRSSRLLRTRILHFERGWFASQAELEVTFGSPATPQTLLLSSRVQHGPLGFARGFFWGRFRAVAVPGPENLYFKELAEAVNLPHLFELRSTAHLGGGGHFEVLIPPIRAVGADLVDPDALGSIDFAGMQLRGDWSAGGATWRIEGGLESFKLAGDAAVLTLRDLSLDLTAHAVTDQLWLGPMALRVGAVALGESEQPASLSGQALALSIDSSARSGEATTDLTATVRAAQIALTDTALRDAQVSMSLPSIPVAALDHYLENVDGPALRTALAAAAPVATFQPIAFSLAGGAFAAKLQVALNDHQVPPAAVLQSSDLRRWLDYLHIEGALQVAAPLAEKIVAAGQQQPLGAALQLLELLDQGLLRPSGDGYATALVLYRGELRVNEQVVPLVQLLQ